MLDPTLAAAFIDNGVKHVVLGVRLRPFSLWHRLLLLAVDSPFLKKGEVRLFDLRVAVGICRLRFGQSKVRHPRPGLSLLRRGLQGEVEAFLRYAGDYLSRPEYDVVAPEDKGVPRPRRGAPPEIMQIAADVIGWTHWPEAVVWELPIGRAHWYAMMGQRAGGADVDYLTEEEREFQAEMKRNPEPKWR